MSNWKVPFDQNGDLLRYDKWDSYEKKDNFEFEVSTAEFIGFERGRSSAISLWRLDGREYPMFLTDLKDLLLKVRIEEGFISSPFNLIFTFSKKGSNLGVKLSENNFIN
ncbi:hypothetical protein MHB40_20565 [Lysinibacillus sp. FSL K6-0057]|uniref:hypothetical protein n=1 Tax=unclassified Lysinibacillus TaxID=2636778 RepID=UPI00315A303D